MLNGMPVVSAIFLAREVLRSKPMPDIYFFKIYFLSKIHKNLIFTLKSSFQNKIIIRQQDAKLEKVLRYFLSCEKALGMVGKNKIFSQPL
jgi:hypothetical protein